MALLTRLGRAIKTVIQGTVGATGFLTRIPVGASEVHWTAFCRRPEAMVLVAYPVGLVLALVAMVPLPAATVGLLFPVWLLVLTGITHLDGLADLGDAAVVHGDPARRREVMKDTTTGVGALAAVVLALVAVAFAGAALATISLHEVGAIVVGAEVGAKLAMLVSIGLGTTAHDGLGPAVAENADAATIGVGAFFAVPVIVFGGTVVVVVVLSAVVAALGMLAWATTRLGGTSGDVFGATNDLARIVGLHAGLAALGAGATAGPIVPEVIGWTLL